MNFLDIGPLELLVILFLLLIVFGPNKLPGIATQIGKGIRKFKQATAQLSREMQAEADGIKKERDAASGSGSEIARTAGEMVREVRSVGTEIKKEMSSAGEALKDFDKVAGGVEGELKAAPVPVAKTPSGKPAGDNSV